MRHFVLPSFLLISALLAGCAASPQAAPPIGPELRAEREVKLNHIVLATRQIAIDDVEQGRYPPDIQSLVLESDLTVAAFILPGRQVPQLRDEQAEAEWAQRHGDYVYLGGDLTDAVGPDVILVHENLAAVPPGDMIGVGYADGSVAFLAPAAFEEARGRHDPHRPQAAAR